MKIGIDIDDVLFPWYAGAHRACEAAGITNGVTPRTWTPSDEYGCSLQDWLDVLAAVTLDGTLYGGEPYPGAADALTRLHDAGHTIHLVTARGFLQHGNLIKRQTVDWLDRYAIPHDTLTFSKDKTLVPVDVFADDSERNVRQLTAAGTPVCLIEAEHNGHVIHEWRAATITDFVNDVLEAA